jgi:hypothetical protein
MTTSATTMPAKRVSISAESMIDRQALRRRDVGVGFVSVVVSFTGESPIRATGNRATNDNVPPAESDGGHASFY